MAFRVYVLKEACSVLFPGTRVFCRSRISRFKLPIKYQQPHQIDAGFDASVVVRRPQKGAQRHGVR